MANLTVHTSKTLYAEWNRRYTDTKDRIKKLREMLAVTTDDKKLSEIEHEIQELYIQANLIHQFLADVGVMARIDEIKSGGVMAENATSRP